MKRSRSHVTGDFGERLFPTLIPAEFIPDKQTPDYGIDYVVRVVDTCMVTGMRIACQIKTVERRHPRVGDSLRVVVETAHLTHWMDVEAMPVLLVAIDGAEGRGYFVDVDTLTLPDGWRGQTTVTVSVPEKNVIGDNVGFRDAARAAWNRRMGPQATLTRRKRELESRDPRFRVKLTVTEGQETAELQAVETFDARFTVRSPEKFAALLRGDLVTMAPGELEFDNLPLLEDVTKVGGLVRFAKERDVQVSLVAMSPTGRGASIINVPAKMTAAPAVVRFAGRLSALSFHIEGEPGNNRLKASVTLDPRHWANQPLAELSFFDEIKTLFDHLGAGASLKWVLHTPGHDITLGDGAVTSELVSLGGELLALVALACDVDRATGAGAHMPPVLTPDHELDIRQLHALLTAGEFRSPGKYWNTSLRARVLQPISDEPGEVKVVFRGERKEHPFLDTKVSIEALEALLTEAVVRVSPQEEDGLQRIALTTTTGEYIYRATVVRHAASA